MATDHETDPGHGGDERTALIKPLVFGGIDGLTTTLALVWGSMAAGEQLVSSNAVLVLGVANLMATATSMGIGDYVGTLAQYESEVAAQRRRLVAADAGDSDAERGSAAGGDVLPASLHSRRGHPERETDAKRAVRKAALRSGLTMFLSFVAFGGLPLLPYLPWAATVATKRVVATVLCAVSFFILGTARALLEHGLGGPQPHAHAHAHTVGALQRPFVAALLDACASRLCARDVAARVSSRGAFIAAIVGSSVKMMLMGVAAALVSFVSSRAIYLLLGAEEPAGG